MSKDKWIAGAIKHPGALRETAKRDHLIKGDEPLSFADMKKLSDSRNDTTARRARLAMTLKGINS